MAKNNTRFSLVTQVILIFTSFALLIMFVLVPIISNNLNRIIDNEMFEVLDNSQNSFKLYSFVPNANSSAKQIYHFTYDSKTKVLYPANQSTYQETKELYGIIKKSLNTMVKNKETTFQAKGNLHGQAIYYQIDYLKKNTYVISLLYSDYSLSLVSSINSQILYIIYGAFIVLGVSILIWVSSLIKNLRKVETYIKDISVGKETELVIRRNDEVASVADGLVKMKKALDQQNKIQEEMIHNISHDLKTPIALINTYAQSVKDGIYPYGDKDKSLDVIIENADRLDSKVRSLLYLNRLDYLSSETTDQETNMTSCIELVVNQLKVMHSDIEIKTDLKENIIFNGAEEHWRICIENILDNAYRFVQKTIRIKLKEDYLEIHNDGEQIDEELIGKLFKPYKIGNKGQFGLGLSIVHKTVTMYGYKVDAVNKNGGVAFIIQK